MADEKSSPLHILVYGSGAIGTYIGGQLQVEGHRVAFLGRPRLAQQLQQHGLQLCDLDEKISTIPAKQLTVATSLADLPPPKSHWDYILVCCKLTSLEAAAQELHQHKQHLHPNTILVSMHNGVHAGRILRGLFPQQQVLICMIGISVKWEDIQFSLGSSLPMVLEEDRKKGRHVPLAEALLDANFPLTTTTKIAQALYAKLLINLFNPINAVAGKTVMECLKDRQLRSVWSAAIEEALQVYDVLDIKTAPLSVLSNQLLPCVLKLPNWMFFRIARSMFRIKSDVVTSMLMDVRRGGPTEIQHLAGEIVKLGNAAKVDTPVNRKLVQLIERMEQRPANTPPTFLQPHEIYYLTVGELKTRRCRFWHWQVFGVLVGISIIIFEIYFVVFSGKLNRK
eukprot:TRINITY_DN700_c0_g5_i1.p1 TRINITY_DN700_c0_g5~~TRINITY_DN700_c0_g5_i1.p1  ORF type:complete len:395 (+),score=86.20 TRINITY_DN700_c0_g5_i1:58-1242(+)